MAKESKEKTSQQKSITFPASILEPIRMFLTGEKAKLEQKQKELDKRDPFSDPDRVNDNASSDDEADEQLGHAQASALKGQLDRRLVQIRKALTRIKVGNYGTCEKCGKMIDTDRLILMPEATKCASCAKKEEI